jgi:hypothetical protein
MTAAEGDRDPASKLKAIKERLDEKLKSNAEVSSILANFWFRECY